MSTIAPNFGCDRDTRRLLRRHDLAADLSEDRAQSFRPQYGVLSPGADHLSAISDKCLSLRPVLVGVFQQDHAPWRSDRHLRRGAYMIVVVAAQMLPETKGKTLVAFG